MTRHEYAIATRAVATLHKAAHFPSSDQDEAVISREARLVALLGPEIAKGDMKTLLCQHAHEWNGFLDDLPSRSWIRTIIGRL